MIYFSEGSMYYGEKNSIQSLTDEIFYLSVMSELLIVLFISKPSLFIFWLEDLSVVDRDLLKSPSIIVF